MNNITFLEYGKSWSETFYITVEMDIRIPVVGEYVKLDFKKVSKRDISCIVKKVVFDFIESGYHQVYIYVEEENE